MRLTLYRGMIVVLTLLFVELACGISTRLLVSRGWMTEIPRLSERQIESYLKRQTPLGWGPPLNQAEGKDPLGSRGDSRGKALDAAACATAYGDSFTAGSGVADDKTYPYELSTILECRVTNYGIGGFGSDQAFMLWRAQRHLDSAPVVLLGHLSENILRNVNQYRNLLYPGQELFFKPRFVEQASALIEVPVPVRTAQDFEQLQRDPATVLRHEAFIDRPRRRFPYSLALLRWLMVDFHVRSRLAGIPRHEAFYSADHPSGALRLTTDLLATFAREAVASGQTPFVVLIPMGDDFFRALTAGRWPDRPLAEALAGAGVTVIHAGPQMLARLQGENPCALFADCNGHYNARGYRMLAEIVAEQVRDAIAARRDRPQQPTR